MLYDMRSHLPGLVDMMIEDIRAGDTIKLSWNKMMITKLLDNHNDFNKKIKFIDDEYNKIKDPFINEIKILQEKLEIKFKALDDNDKRYWETVIGEIIRTINSIPSPSVANVD
jgi:S-adenosylmethionine synthetase